MMLVFDSITPLGWPELPEVKITNPRSSPVA